MFKLIELNHEQKSALDLLTYAEWGTKLSVEEFLKREDLLRATKWARENMVTWGLTLASGEIVSSCESFRVDFNSLGGLVSVYEIASVFTPESLRGKGYATQLMNDVMQTVEARDSKCSGWILYSDIKPSYYAKMGYEIFSNHDWALPAKETTRSIDVEFFSGHSAISENLKTLSDKKLSDTSISAALSFEEFEWIQTREIFYSEQLKRKRLAFAGASFGESFLLWSVDYKKDQMLILCHDFANAQEMETLLASAQKLALQHGLTQVCVWEEDKNSSRLCSFFETATSLQAKRQTKEDCIPMFRRRNSTDYSIDWIPRFLWV